MKKMIEDSCEIFEIYEGLERLDFSVEAKDGSNDIFSLRQQELKNDIYAISLNVLEYDAKAHKNGEIDLYLNSENKLNVEELFERLKEEYEQGSEIHYQKVLEEFPTFINPHNVVGTIKNTKSFIGLKECDNLDLEIIDEKSYEGNVREIYIKNENENSHFYSFYSNDWEEKSKETHFSNGNIVYEYEDSALYVNEINKMKIEIEGNKIKFNNMTPEEMVKKGDFGTRSKKDINSLEDFDYSKNRFLKQMFEQLNNNAGDIVKCSFDTQDKIKENFEKSFDKIRNKMLKQEKKKNNSNVR